ncbi:amidase [Brachybacterium sp. J144]|uniref:amidase n=1 Tax=Brachybacterium sp. J144 TaxID=3116487 RepID=UPI002E7900C8|nr:amidase [Brachybacterium sp. J144]MEE1649393.1 amidase [Brachybacterium sp. J144]
MSADAAPDADAPLSALGTAAALRRGELDARELAEDVLERARSVGARVGAFAHVLEDLTRRQAEEVAAQLEDARRHGRLEELAAERPLLGVPLPIKDLSRIAGEPFEAGSLALRGTVAEVTDGVAQRLLDAGTLTVGKTSTPEFGMPCYTEPATGAPARTPWDLRRTAGGSSGGAGAAVASGIVPIAHGSDGGGSVRIPAACCGVLGLKPSRGLVSPGPFGAEGMGLVTDGILARTVADVAAGLDVIAEQLPGDAAPLRPEPGGYLAGLGGPLRPLRIGVLREPLAAETVIHPAALRGVDRAVGLLHELGHELIEVPAPFTAEEWTPFMPLWTVGAATLPLAAEQEAQLLELTRWLRERGRAYSGAELALALSGVQSLARRTGEAFAPFDVILSPALAGPPALPETLQLDRGEDDFDAQRAFTPFTSTWNMTGRAALAVPLHRERIDGVELPLGVLLGATRAGDDLLLLRLAAQLEAHDPWPLVREPVDA